MVAPAVPRSIPLSTRIGGFVALTKPRIIELLLVTTVPTMIVANNGVPSLWLIFATVFGGTLAAGGANATNMYVDRDIDAVMNRTQDRPLVNGLMTPNAALTFAVSIEAVAFVWLTLTVNLLSAVLALTATLIYVFIYTLWLKRTSRQNIVIGGIAGCMPVLIGYSSVTNSLSQTFAVAPLALFALMFFWTPPHFWALAVKYKDDYSAVEVPMLPVVASMRETTIQMLVYTVLVVASSFVFGWAAEMGVIFWAVTVASGAVFIWYAVQVLRTESPAKAIKMFAFSISYVTLVFAAMAVDVIVRQGW
ncbi:MAG: heme o synthase [Microthrixaceae bacterium]